MRPNESSVLVMCGRKNNFTYWIRYVCSCVSELRQRTKNAEERRRKDEIEEEEEERIEIPVAFALLPKSSGWMAG